MNSERSTWQVALAVVGVLAVAAIWGVVLATSPEPAVDVGGESAAEPTLTPTEQPILAELNAGSRVLFLGDSYTVGYGASEPEKAWAPLVADRLGWRPTFRGVGGTGYVWGGGEKGADGLAYLTRLDEVAESGATFDGVVLEGSQNDYRSDPGQITRAVERVIARAEKTWPDAEVIVFGPTAPQPLGDALAPIADAVGDAAEARGLPYIDPVAEGWLADQNSRRFDFDSAHVNDAGHAYLADRFVEDLRGITVPVRD